MTIFQTPSFKKQKKKLHLNQINELDKVVKKLRHSPELGELKKGDLQGVRVYKFKLLKQEYLLAYMNTSENLCLLALAPHENFYRDLKITF